MTDSENVRIALVSPLGGWLRVHLSDGTTLHVRADRFTRLRRASDEDLRVHEIICDGEGVHWPYLDEDISIRGFRRYAESPPKEDG